MPLPVKVIAELLGVPAAEGGAQFRDWTIILVTSRDRSQVGRTVLAMADYLRGLIARKRFTPADDLISAMIAARDEGDRLNEDELTSLALLILWAGYEASVHLIGNGVLELLRHPGQMELLGSRPEVLPRAVDELIRYTAPIPYAIRRFATEDLDIGDVRVAAGDTVLLCLGSADRDPAIFPSPDRLDVTRADVAHLGFGHGIHYCLGAPLARIETETAIATLIRRLPQLTLAVPIDELQWLPSFRVRGLIQLPVTWRIAEELPRS